MAELSGFALIFLILAVPLYAFWQITRAFAFRISKKEQAFLSPLTGLLFAGAMCLISFGLEAYRHGLHMARWYHYSPYEAPSGWVDSLARIFLLYALIGLCVVVATFVIPILSKALSSAFGRLLGSIKGNA